jgi:YD repeat-containing protein
VFIKYDPEKMIDRKPFIIESIKYPSGERYEMTYKNDSKGRPEEETIFDLMGSVISKIIIRRDVNGNALEYNFSDGNVDQFKYDDQGYRIESISHTASGNKVITTYKYDLSGNLIEENINDFFKTAYKYHFEHNTYTYQYDKQENWIERTEYEHDIPLRVVIRTIEYAK